MKLKKPLVIFDLETTGTWVTKDKIVEIGMIRRMPDGSRQDYIKRVNPGIPIPANVSRLINITDEDVKNEPPFKNIVKEVLDFIGDADLGGFNIQRFDIPLLEREIFEAGLTFHYQNRNIYDTQKVYRLHEKRDLVAAYQLYCKKELHSAHTALGDAEATMEILDAQVKMYGSEEEGVESLKDLDYETKSDYFDKERKFCWWNGELYPTFGKYGRKKHIKNIYRDDRRYLEWILTKDFSDTVKELITDVLKGVFPEPPGNI